MDLQINYHCQIICYLVLFELCVWLRADMYSSMADMKQLWETHRKISDSLDEYVIKEKRRLYILKKHLYRFKTEHEKAMKDIPEYIENPINAFTLIKRLTADLDFIEETTRRKTSYTRDTTVRYPTQEDLDGAAQGINRLQITYRLNVTELANGNLNYSMPMSAEDCSELGWAMLASKDYESAIAWMQEAIRKYETQTHESFDRTTISLIIKDIVAAYESIGDIRKALVWTKKLISVKLEDDQSSHLEEMVEQYEKRISAEEKFTKPQVEVIEEEQQMDVKSKKKIYENPEVQKKFEALCRNEINIPSEIDKRLKCRYLTEHHPFLKLAPFKLEQLYVEPDVVMLHEVMSDQEIQHLKDMATPKLSRVLVYSLEEDKGKPSPFLISKSKWMEDNTADVSVRLNHRIADFTGLSMLCAEPLQISNYGIGGYFKPHYDFLQNRSSVYGNVLATVLLYMSDVMKGGATVFPKLGLTVFPVKRAALFWMNLHPSGEGDLATNHAGCPVLLGSKWVINKWIYECGQELRMRCNPANFYKEHQTAQISHLPVDSLYRRDTRGEPEVRPNNATPTDQ